MITGSGLIANALQESFQNDDSVLVFARGVSNSTCTDDTAYSKEFEMINSSAQKEANKIFVYFSTTSVFDTEKQHTKYVQEKLKFEQAIASLFSKSIVIRLPIIVGRNNNENQLVGYLLKAIKNNQFIRVHKYASRYLIDVADISVIVKRVIEFYKASKQNGNLTIDICGDQPIPITSIISMLSKATKTEAKIVMEESGTTYFVDNSAIKAIVENQILNKDFQKVFNDYFQ